MALILKSALFLILSLALCSFTVQAARVVEYEYGQLVFTDTPTRIVVLEYSFIDALAAVGVSPIGVADDQNPERIIPAVRSLIKPWTSVGMRSQPNLEVIAQLKPDLIIADAYRHKVSYDDLTKIAPTMLLKSRGESYQESLRTAQIIGKALNKEEAMRERIAQHNAVIESYREKFAEKGTVQFASVNDRGMWMHGPLSYTGSLLDSLGLNTAIADLHSSHLMEVNLELFLRVNPDWLFYSKNKPVTILDSWQKSPLYALLNISKTEQAVQVAGELWSLNRGMLAAEGIAKELDKHLN